VKNFDAFAREGFIAPDLIRAACEIGSDVEAKEANAV
jgi:hypothetical protein